MTTELLQMTFAEDKSDIEEIIAKEIAKQNLTPEELKTLLKHIKLPQQESKIYIHEWGNKHIRIGLVSDTHYGSRFAQPEVVDDIYKRFRKAKVAAVYLSGDITEGYNMRPGHAFECTHHGADAQLKAVIESLPNIEGVKTYFITGDHDSSHFKSAGVDIGKMIAKDRSDTEYLGMFSATIKIFPETTMQLLHPGRGSAYAISYYTQKLIDSLSGGEKPNILVTGHTHKIEQLFYRNVHAFQAGCVEAQSDWMKRMNLAANVGAWILDIYSNKKGSVDKIVSTLLPYY